MRERRGGDKGGGCVVSWMLENGRYSETLRMVRRNGAEKNSFLSGCSALIPL